jgi:carbamoyl-phosphate synthase large subunit
MKTILITGIGSDIAQGIAKIVREIRPEWRIVGVDIHQRHGGILFADVVESVVRADDPDYVESMSDLAKRHDIDVCLPVSEAELAVICRQGITHFGDAVIVGVAHSAVEIGLDKLSTARFIEKIGIPTPWTIPAESETGPHFLPCIFKPRRSAGSKGVYICNSLEDAAWYISKEPNGVFQELLLPADQEITCAIFRSRTGETAVLPMLRELVGGFTGWAEVIAHDEVVDQCRKLADALDLNGAINVQLRITKNGPRIFEINPRFSSTVYMRHLLGFRDMEWMIEEYEGKPISFPSIPAGTIAVRVQGAQVVKKHD